jgi:hypothetical protein
MSRTGRVCSFTALLTIGLCQKQFAQDAATPIATAEAGRSNTQPGKAVVLDALPQVTPADLQARREIPAPRTGVSEAVYRARKAQAAIPTGPSSLAPAPDQPSVATDTPGTTTSFNGISEFACGGFIPPDQGLAVGPTFVVQIINSCIAVFTKAGALQAGYPKSQNTFFGVAGSHAVGDARIIYDWVNNRYIVSAEDFSIGQIIVAASATSDPRGSWFIYKLPSLVGVGDFPDFPTLGQDRLAIYVGFTDFTASGGISDFVMYLPKTQIYVGAGFSFFFNFNFNVGGTNVDSIQPVNTMNRTDRPRAEFMINSLNLNFGGGQCVFGCRSLVVWAVSNSLVAPGSPGPEVTGRVITTANTFSLPPNARQPGCTSGACLIDTGDVRISGQAVYSEGSIYASLNTKASAGPGSTVIWYRIDPQLNDNDSRCGGAFTNKCPQITSAIIREEECYFCGGRGVNGSNYYGTLSLDSEGNSTIVYAYSDDSFFPGVAYTSKRVTSLTLHDNGIFLATGGAFYEQLDGSGRNRWGDYTAVAPDFNGLDPNGLNTTMMWFAGEFSNSSGNWATRIGTNRFTSLSQP